MDANPGGSGARRPSPHRGTSPRRRGAGSTSPRGAAAGGTSPCRSRSASPVLGTSPRLENTDSIEVDGRRVSARVHDRTTSSTVVKRARQHRREVCEKPKYPAFSRIATPPPFYAEELEIVEDDRRCSILTRGHPDRKPLYYTIRPFLFPRPSDTETVDFNEFQTIDPDPRVLDLNGTVFLASDLNTRFYYYQRRVNFRYDQRVLYELMIYPHEPMPIDPDVPFEIECKLSQFNRHVVRLSRILTGILFDAYNSWINRNFLRTLYETRLRDGLIKSDNIIRVFKDFEDELKVVVTHGMRAVMSFERCRHAILSVNAYYDKIRKLPEHSTHRRVIMRNVNKNVRVVQNKLPKVMERVRAAFVHSDNLYYNKGMVCGRLKAPEMMVGVSFRGSLKLR